MNKTIATFSEKNISDKSNQLGDSFLNKFFAVDDFHGKLRLVALIIFLLGTWVVFASFFNDVIIQPNLLFRFEWLKNYPLIATLFQYSRFLFRPNTVIFMALIYLAMRLAVTINSFCLARSFGILNVEKAKSRLLKSAFSLGQLDLLEIEDGQQFSDGNGQITRLLGGPATIKIEKDNAAVFENAFGESIISSPAFLAQFKVDGFVRAIKLFDLREHSAIVDIYCRTRDGVPLILKNIQPIFSVQNIFNFSQESQNPTNLDHIYWMTYQMTDSTWQNYFFNEFTRQFSLFINHKKLIEIVSMMKTNLGSEDLREIEHNIEQCIVYHSSHNNLKPYVPIHVQYRFHKKKEYLHVGKKLPKVFWKHFFRSNRCYKFKDAKTSIYIPDSLFQEFRENFNLKMKPYRVSLDWITTGSLHLPASINRSEIWHTFLEKERWANFVLSEGERNYLQLKKKFYLVNKIQSYKAHNVIVNGKFNAPNQEDIQQLQNTYSRQMLLGQYAYKRRFGKGPTKLENAITELGLISSSKLNPNENTTN